MKKEEDKDLFLLDYHNVEKAKRMFPKGSLDNHLQSKTYIYTLKPMIVTAFNAICKIWDTNEEAKKELEDLGLDFSRRKFAPDQYPFINRAKHTDIQ